MKKFTLLCALLLVGVGLMSSAYAAQFKFSSKPHARIGTALQTTDRIYVPTNRTIGTVRVGLYIKSVRYSSLRIELTSPYGVKVILKQEVGKGTLTTPGPNWPGSLGSDRSYCVFRDGGNTISATSFPNDNVFNPATPLSALDNTQSLGWWTITVFDEGSYYVPWQDGYLEGWTLFMNSVTQEPEQVLWTAEYQGNNLKGMVNGDRWVPNPAGDLDNPCSGAGDDAIVQIGLHGEAFGFYCPVAGTVGAVPPGMHSKGRFRITLSCYVNDPGNFTYNGDIAAYFGKVGNFVGTWTPTGNLINPANLTDPVPPATQQAKSAKAWPRGGGLTTTTLLPNTASPLFGGVRLFACEDAIDPNLIWSLFTGFTDIVLDDKTVPAVSISGATVDMASYLPSAPLSLLDGQPLQGLYYVSIYDTYGENGTHYGRIRVDRIKIEYVVGNEPVPDPLHQGFAGPMMGVPIPGAIANQPFGYLADVICAMPPYSVYALDQDPLLVYWAMGKMYPKTASGFERLETISSTNYVPPQGVRYTGPWNYPAQMDENAMVAGVSVNTDLILGLPTGDYKFRTTLSQPRYDDDVSDNQFESNSFQVTESTLGYYGDQILQWNYYQNHNNTPLTTHEVAPTQGVGTAFTVFKYPYSNLSSIDYKFDVAAVVTPQANLQMNLYSCGGYYGAPTTLIAQSPIISYNQYISGNWRSFPMFTVTNGTCPIALAPGTYVAVLKNVDGTRSYTVTPYTFGMVPAVEDRFRAYAFADNFGPVAPFAVGGTRLGYYHLTTGFQSLTSQVPALGNYTFPMRFNFPNQPGMAGYPNLNDFAVNYVTLGGELANGSAPIGNFTSTTYPYVYVSNNAPTQGATSCNVRLEIYNSGNQLVYAAPDYVMNFTPATCNQNTPVQRPSWIPTTPGLYTVKAYLTRKPNDQNPVNDQVQSTFYVTANSVVLALGGNVSSLERDNALNSLRNRGLNVEVANIADVRDRQTDVYVIGQVSDNDRESLRTAQSNGSTIAFMYDKNGRIGNTIRSIDAVYNIDRGTVDYDNVRLYSKTVPSNEVETPVVPQQIELKSKEDLVNFLKSANANLKSIDIDPAKAADIELRSQKMYENTLGQGNVDITYIASETNDMGILYTFPTTRQNATLDVDQAAPAGFALDQNYPNPFNPSTTISYRLPEASFVTLRILDVLGREIATLVSGNQEAGSYATTWQGLDNLGKDVASGTYMFRIDATPLSGGQGFTNMRKMTLSK